MRLIWVSPREIESCGVLALLHSSVSLINGRWNTRKFRNVSSKSTTAWIIWSRKRWWKKIILICCNSKSIWSETALFLKSSRAPNPPFQVPASKPEEKTLLASAFTEDPMRTTLKSKQAITNIHRVVKLTPPRTQDAWPVFENTMPQIWWLNCLSNNNSSTLVTKVRTTTAPHLPLLRLIRLNTPVGKIIRPTTLKGIKMAKALNLQSSRVIK